MKKLIALALALVLALTVCSAFAEEAITLKIAHIGPLTGPAALYGIATSRGAQIAVGRTESGRTIAGSFAVHVTRSALRLTSTPRPPDHGLDS